MAQQNNKRRQQQGRGSGLPAPIRPVRGKKQIGRYVSSRVRREFRPVAKQINKDLRQSRAQQKQLGGLYRGYNEATRNIAGQLQASTNAAVAETDARLAANSTAGAQFGEQLAAQQAADAKLRGAPVDSSAATREQAATASRGLDTAGQAGLIRAQGESRNAQMLDNIRIGKGQRIQDVKDLFRKRGELRSDKRELTQKRGQFKNEVLDDLRQRERDFFIQNRAFAGDKSEIAKDLDYNQAIRDVARMGLQGDTRRANANLGVAKQQGRNQKQEGQAKSKSGIRRGLAILQDDAGGSIDWRFTRRNRTELANALVRQGVKPQDAKAAVARQIRQQRRKEQELRNSRPATGNTSLPGIENPGR